MITFVRWLPTFISVLFVVIFANMGAEAFGLWAWFLLCGILGYLSARVGRRLSSWMHCRQTHALEAGWLELKQQIQTNRALRESRERNGGLLMPGPVSDAFDPEWGTRANADEIMDALLGMHARVTGILGGEPPMWILDLVRAKLPHPISATLTEKEWRLLRFALERASESI